MSAAAARRRKQLALKKKKAEDSGTDPLIEQVNKLLKEPDESSAYEALQVAQGQVRRLVNAEKGNEAVLLANDISQKLLENGCVSVASQLMNVLLDVLVEVSVECSSEWVDKIKKLDEAYRSTLEKWKDDENKKDEEYERLMRLQYHFLKKAVKWSADRGTVLFGDLVLHSLLGEQCLRLHSCTTTNANKNFEDETEISVEGARAEAVTHLALAEKPERIGTLLATLQSPTSDEEKMGRDGDTAAERDCLLTRSILVFAALQNLRDANVLIQYFDEEVNKDCNLNKLAKSYMNKSDGSAPTHVIFCCMLLRICEKDRAGPLFEWLLRSFATDLGKMKPDVKSYTSKIGRVYFGIQPPPDMLSMMENMMGMMGGGGMGGMMAPNR